jgi:hypothetical protein
MQLHLKRRGFTSGWTVAAVSAAVLVVAQCLAVAHFHPKQTTSVHCSTAASLDDGLCALCLLHQCSPAVAAASPFAFSHTVIDHVELYAAQSWPLYAFNSYLSGRSPPTFA